MIRLFPQHHRKSPSASAPPRLWSRNERAAWFALPIVTIVWGLSWPAMKVALAYSGPFTFSAWRYALGTVVAFAWLVVTRARMKPPPWYPTIIIGLSQTAAFQAMAEWALLRGGAGKTALLAYTMPFWVVGLAWWWLGERPRVQKILCIGVAAAGLVCVIQPWQGVGDPLSDIVAIASGFCWAIGTVVSKRTFQRYRRVTPAQLTAWQMLIGTLGLLVLAFVIPERAVAWTPEYLTAILYTGVLSTGLGWVLWTLIVQRLPANVAGLTSLGVPITGVLLSWALLGERPSEFETVGMVLIAAAILALNFVRDAARAHPSKHEPASPAADR
ncbi:MAG: DMT family transporter [Acetobacteraceae bacterium]